MNDLWALDAYRRMLTEHSVSTPLPWQVKDRKLAAHIGQDFQ